MPHSDDDPSLSERIRSLSLAPDLQDVLVTLAERTEPSHAAEYQEMLNRAGGAPYRGPRGPKHKRDRHGMYGIRGGLAAAMPLPFLFHDGLAPVAAVVGRVVCRSKHVQAAAGLVALSALAALVVPTPGAVDAPAEAAHQPPGRAAVDLDHHQHPGLRGTVPVRKRRRSDGDAGAMRAHRDVLRDDHAADREVPPRWGHRPAGARRTSSVRNPGPRREEGRTVTWKHAATRARRVARGRASNSCSVMPAWASSSRPCASRPASSRSSASRWSMPSRRASSRCKRSPMAGSAMAASASPRWVASAANWAARPGAWGTRPAGLPGWLRRSTVRVVT